jgi:hypothetical protein
VHDEIGKGLNAPGSELGPLAGEIVRAPKKQ